MVDQQVKVLERRMRMMELWLQNVPPTKIMESIREEYRNERRTPPSLTQLWDDWQKRPEWMQQLVRLKDVNPEAVVVDLLAGMQQSRAYLMNLYMTSGNDNAKVGAMKAYMESVAKEVELRQGLGQLPKAAENVNVQIASSDWFKKLLSEVFGDEQPQPTGKPTATG